MKKKLIIAILALFTAVTQAKEVEWLLNENELGQQIISLKINNENVDFKLDTGSITALSLPLNIINKIKDKVEKKDKLKFTDGLGNVHYSRQFVVHNLIINDLFYEQLEVDEYQPWGFVVDVESGDKITTQQQQEINEKQIAVAGLGLFIDKMVTFDVRSHKLTLSDDFTTQLASDWFEIPFFTSSKGHLLVNVTDNEKNYILALDTGAGSNAIMSQRLSKQAELIKKEDLPFPITELSFVDMPNVKEFFAVLDEITDEMPFDGVLGYGFFYNHIVKVDFKNRKIWVKPYPEEVENQ